MLKRGLNTVICIWIINSIVYFHALNPFAANGINCDVPGGKCIVSSTLIDSIIDIGESLFNDQDHDHDHKIATKCRYLVSRNISTSVPAPFNTIFDFTGVSYKILNTIKNTAFAKASLPKYYSFLFRLSPF
ncbi:hypothetical protein IDJ75_15030 [Mucilaginibacter rigui]|uniref:Uncharacterized protein n=1 Tax=Mucilaginibacter rigui TaxID=534635 RepID=A0ABR7X7R4_9SPHI|nr:hypothetical protein [Mucilaginibacter rigui]MBD1386599.1 hypothetical protein [Mucilaginibacter rigui]